MRTPMQSGPNPSGVPSAEKAIVEGSPGNILPAPRVSIIMPLADVRRFRMATRAVEQFGNQTYKNRELIIVNSSGRRLTSRDTDMGREIMVDAVQCPTIGALRNRGLKEASGEWIMPWDDDDYSHAHRIAFQMAHRVEGACVLLQQSIRVDVRNNVACVWHEPQGIAGSVLFPKTLHGDDFVPCYDESLTSGGEDVEFLNHFSRRVLVENGPTWFPGPALLMAFWHGLNVVSREAFLGRYAAPEFSGRRQPELTPDLIDYLKYVLDVYGMEVKETPEGAPGDNPDTRATA